jgi:ribosomal protein S28E/S33
MLSSSQSVISVLKKAGRTGRLEDVKARRHKGQKTQRPEDAKG